MCTACPFVAARRYSSASQAKRAASRQAYLYQCTGCQTHYWQAVGQVVEKGKGNVAFKPGIGPPVGQHCEHCGRRCQV